MMGTRRAELCSTGDGIPGRSSATRSLLSAFGIKFCCKVDNLTLNLKPLNSGLELHCLPKTF